MPNDLFALLGSSQSASATLVNALLKQLETGEPTPPARPAVGRTILGTLGDALQAMGAVRGGGRAAPLGPFGMQIAGRQALFERQKEEFENRRLQTLQALATLEGQQEQRDISNRLRIAQQARPVVREFELKVAGKPRRIRQTLDPTTGEPIDTMDLGEVFVPPTVTPGVPTGGAPTLGTVDRTTGTFVPVTGSKGGSVAPVPPAGIVEDVSKTTTALEGLERLRAAYNKIRQQTAGTGSLLDIARQRIGVAVGERRIGGALAPQYASYVAARRIALNAYIKKQTGAQFSIKELERYETQYPEPWDPPNVAEDKFHALAAQALSDMEAKLRAAPGAASAAPLGHKAAPQKKSASDLADELLVP